MQEPKHKTYSFEEILDRDGILVSTGRGQSMLPLIRENKDILEIRKSTQRVAKYDIVLYKRGSSYLFHRCIKVLPNGKYIFAGDHNVYKEYDVTDQMILGVMTRLFRDGKSIYPNNIAYRLYSHLWVDFFPIKVMILKFDMLGRTLAHKFKKAVFGEYRKTNV